MGNRVTKEQLLEIFDYIDGHLWRKPFVDKDGYLRKAKIVKNKANSSHRYCEICTKYGQLKYHIVVWVLNYGDIPENKIIDHINGNRTDNRLENLRLVTYRQNAHNTYKHRDGRLFGCFFEKSISKWRSQISIQGKRTHLGVFDTEQEAHEAYKAALSLEEKRV